MDIVDAHCHMWRLEVAQRSWLTPEFGPLLQTFDPATFSEASRDLGVKQCVLVEAGKTSEDNRVLEQMADSNLVGAVIPFVNLESPNFEGDLDHWQLHPKFRGVRMGFENHADFKILARPTIIRGLTILAERGLIFEFLVRVHHLKDLLEIYRRIPELKGVIEHMAKPDVAAGSDHEEWQHQMRRLARETNVSCKLSLSPRVEQLEVLLKNLGSGWLVERLTSYVQFVVAEFGFDRLMWGSDWPIALLVSDYAGTYQALRRAVGVLSTADELRLFQDTAVRFYGLAHP